LLNFRPNGVWTKEQEERGLIKKKKKTPTKPKEEEEISKEISDDSFENAQPSLTHMALISLLNEGKLKYIVTQV
jgi:NAD-dependent SIR2 family protein deacetylase